MRALILHAALKQVVESGSQRATYTWLVKERRSITACFQEVIGLTARCDRPSFEEAIASVCFKHSPQINVLLL